MAANNSAFTPGNTIKVTAASSSGRTALTMGGFSQLEIQNAGTVTAIVAFGGDTVTAAVPTGTQSLHSYPVLAGMSKLITVPNTATHVAYIRDGASDATLYITAGSGG